MKKGWLGVGVLIVGLVFLLGILAYALDHLRSKARVVPGLGDAAEPRREEALVIPEGDEDGDIESTRVAIPRALREPSGLVVRVLDEKGERITFVDVLAYRGDELLRADHAMGGTADLIPFDGPGSLRVERNGSELVRLEIPEGRGRYEIVAPHFASVAGIVRVAGVPREGIRLRLESGSDDWLGAWIAYGLETAGLHERSSLHIENTEADGSFRYEWLAPDWSGVLRVEDSDDYRFASGARRLELAYPDEALVLELEALRPEVEFHGRVVSAGQPVSGAYWNLSNSSSGHCDGSGRFSFYVFAHEVEGGWLELFQAELGTRRVELGGTELQHDLGEIELLPTRRVALVVCSQSGAPIAGARARPRYPPRPVGGEFVVLQAGVEPFISSPARKDFHPFSSLLRTSDPTDSAGRGECTLRSGESTIRVSARGYAHTDAVVPEGLSEPLAVVLPRCAAVQALLRDRSGRVPPGLRVRLEARGPPFTWANGYDAEGDELTPENAFDGGSVDGEAERYKGEFWPDSHGRAWIDALRPGVRSEISAVDEYGSVVDSQREVVLAAGEWRRIEFRVQAEPRTLLVVVRDSLGHPLSRVNVVVRPSAVPEPVWSKLYTDRAGMVRTEPFYSDEVTLRMSRRGFEGRTLEHVRVPSEGATVEIRLAHDWWSW